DRNVTGVQTCALPIFKGILAIARMARPLQICYNENVAISPQRRQRRSERMASLSLRNIWKVYPGNVTAVKDFNLEIEDKEFVVRSEERRVGKESRGRG